MMRKVYAFFAFNLYAGLFVWVFQINTAYQFDSAMIDRLKSQRAGIDIPQHWGWGDHYIWRLAASIMATTFAGVLAGAIARSRAGFTAAVSNVPAVAVLGWLSYALIVNVPAIVYGNQIVPTSTGMIVTTLLLIPLTTFLAYVSGEYGAALQRDEFPDGTVLGIAGYHFTWLALPTYLYANVGLLPVTNFLRFNFAVDNGTFVSGLVGLLLLCTAIVSFLPLAWVYQRLRTRAVSATQSLKVVLVNVAILVLGFFAVVVVQSATQWLLSKIH